MPSVTKTWLALLALAAVLGTGALIRGDAIGPVSAQTVPKDEVKADAPPPKACRVGRRGNCYRHRGVCTQQGGPACEAWFQACRSCHDAADACRRSATACTVCRKAWSACMQATYVAHWPERARTSKDKGDEPQSKGKE